MKETFNFFERKRRTITGGFLIFSLLVILTTHHSWRPDSAVESLFRWAGITLVLAGIAGRVWSTMYIGGKKDNTLVMNGPYSMCRNPLYFFSFLAGLGLCLSFQNLLLAVLYFIVFSFYYPFVIKSEERRLEMLFGEVFRAYTNRVPSFVPNVLLFQGGERPPASRPLIMKQLLDGSIFLVFLPVAYLLDRMQEGGILHYLWRIP
ncbi:MAG: isoprenylcysteine carboxylmethyltransferase family protein [Nitrospirota bacterium]